MFRKRTQIDPAKLTTEDAKLLAAVLSANKNQKIFDAVDPKTGRPVKYMLPAPTRFNSEAKKNVVLKSRLVAYPCNKNPAETRYAVCDAKPLGTEGSEGGIFFSRVTLKTQLVDGKLNIISKHKKPDKERCLQLNKSAEEAARAYEFLRCIPLFHAKPVVVDGGRSAIVMRRLAGKSVIDYLIADATDTLFDVDQRIALTILMGEAIIQQPHAYGIIHRDIKADNMMLVIDEYNNPRSVTIIDYDLAKWKGEKGVNEEVGTIEPIDYRAPEAKQNIYTDEKSDAYSYATLLKMYVWQSLFKHEKYKELSTAQKLKIMNTMQQGINGNAGLRASIADIVAVFKKIQSERQKSENKLSL